MRKKMRAKHALFSMCGLKGCGKVNLLLHGHMLRHVLYPHPLSVILISFRDDSRIKPIHTEFILSLKKAISPHGKAFKTIKEMQGRES